MWVWCAYCNVDNMPILLFVTLSAYITVDAAALRSVNGDFALKGNMCFLDSPRQKPLIYWEYILQNWLGPWDDNALKMVQRAAPTYVKYTLFWKLNFISYFILLYPTLPLFIWSSTYRTGQPIWTPDISLDAVCRKEVPFGGGITALSR